ncbi:FG-GAP-like repeat-containing protein [Pontiellaceae bacterium B1224]|nr:FG-GAP-like repeat-containing protein [Pontiellaceae bacterium B1224]
MNVRFSQFGCLALFVGSLFVAGGSVFGASVYTNDFESGIGPEWSLTTLESSVPNPFTTFSGRLGNDTQTLTVSNLTIGAAYSVFFDLYIIDTWDGGADRFNVDIAASNVFSHSFHYNASSQTYPEPPDFGPVNYGFGGTGDSVYRNIEVVFTAVSNSSPISFYGSGLQAVSDESWGIDNVVVETLSPTIIDMTSLPSGTASAAIDWFTVTALRTLSEATATNAASYDLRGAGLDGSFDTPDDALYTLLPSFSNGKTVSISIGNNAPLQPGVYRFNTTTNLQDSADGPVDAFSQTFTIAESANRTVEDLDNGSLGTADSLNPMLETPIGSGFLSAAAIGSFSGGSDYDYWTFDAEAGDVITAWIAMGRDGTYPYLRLLNTSGSIVQYEQSRATGMTYFQTYTVTTPGTYYLQTFPSYDLQPPVNYTLRLDIGRGRRLETENNNSQGQANSIAWSVDGSSLKDASAGALFGNDDYLNLGYLSSGNAMSVNLRFPDGSQLNAGNVNFEIQAAGGAVLLSTNTPLFAYAVSTNTTHYLKINTSSPDLLSQYVLDLTTLDTGVPEITNDNLPLEGSTNTVIIDRFTVDFSEYMDVDSVADPASWIFLSDGPDEIFGSSDDEVYSLAPTYSLNSLSASFSITDGPLQPDRNYRFTATTNLIDRVGNNLSAAYIREFRLENIDLYIHENRNNGTVATATPLGTVSNIADGSVSHLQTVGVGDYPIDVISADLDGDLNPDLITCNYNSDSITILAGNELGTFTVVTNLAAGDRPRQAALGHFNGDAFLDLAVVNEYSHNIGVYLGQAGGTFLPPVTYATANRPYDIKVGDIDGDEEIDLVTVHYDANQLSVLYGDGNGNFGGSTNYPTGSNPQELSLANLNGDNHLDVVVANLSSDNVSVFLNNGDGTLAPPVSYPAGDGARCIKVGDLDNDGTYDLIVGNYNADSISVLMGNGDGTYLAATNYSGCNGPVDVELIDLDDDGFKEIAVASYAGYRLNFFSNQGDGTFTFSSQAYTINYYPYSIAVADFTGDTLDDLAVVNPYFDQVYTYGANARVELPEDPAGSGLHTGFGRGNRSSSSDYDYWSFSAEAGDLVRMAVDVPGNPASSGHYYELVSPEGTVLGGYYTHSSGYGQSPPITIPFSGRYTMLVRHWYGYYSEYRVRVAKVPATLQMESEGNNNVGAANLLTFEPGGGGQLDATMAGSIDVADTAGDYFSLGNLTSGTVVNVTVSTPSTSPLQPEISMFDADDSLVAFSSNLVLRLGGTDADYGIVNPITNFPTTAFTAEFWMKTADTSKGGTPISYARSGQFNEVLLFDYRNFDPHVGGSSYASGVSANNDRWNHIAWTWDSITGTSLLYKNGELTHSNGNWRTAYNITQGGSLVVGQEQDNVGGGFNGSEAFLGELDELRLWNTVRSPAEIQSSMRASLAGSESGLVAYWNFESGTADDLTANGNDLTLFGNSLIIASDLNDPAAYPTNFQYTTTSSGVYHVRVRDALAEAGFPYQYLLDVSLQDGVAPFITDITMPAGGSSSLMVTDRFTITFSEEMDEASVNNVANYDLRSAGADMLLDTADDEIYTLVPTYTTGLQASYIIADGPLQPGAVRFTVTTGLLDRAGLAMAADHLRSFTVAIPSGFNLESRNNGSIATATSLGTAIPGEPDGSLVNVGSFATGTNPYALIMTNFNGDAYLDIATANYSSDDVSILLGNGDGTFTSSTNVYSGDTPVGIEAAQLDGDANLDLVVVNLDADTVTVLLGDGAGGFAYHTNHYAGNRPRDIAIADMNNDGILDLVVCNEYSDDVGVLLGNGDGSFSNAIPQYCGNSPFALAVGDLNGDGINDVVTANNNSDDMAILFGNGDGSLQAAVTQYSGDAPRSISVTDIDFDSVPDILVANFSSDNLVLFHGLGGGTFTNMGGWYVGDAPWGDISVADVDGDGLLDAAVALYYGSQLAILEQLPDGSFSGLSYYPVGTNPLDAGTGDIDGDGLPDFAVANYSSHNVTILLGNDREALAEDPPGSGLYGSFGQGNIADASDFDFWSFSAEAGDIATAALSIPGHPNGSQLQLIVYKPDGASLGTWTAIDTGGALQTAPQTLPVSGRYTVRVGQYDAYRGEYHLAVQLAKPPVQVESEANDDIANADVPALTLSAGKQQATVAGFSLFNTGYDYYSLGNLASGTVIQASVELPSFHNMWPELELLDPAGNAIHLMTNGTTQVLNLDGASDYLRHTTTNFNPRSGTVEGWVFPREAYDWGFWQTHDSASENWTDWFAMFSYTENTFYYRVGNGSSYQDVTFNSSGSISPYRWTHLAFTWEGTSMKVYINGTLHVSRDNATLQDVMDPFARMGIGHGRWLDGWLEDMSVWNRPLSQSEIETVRDQTLIGNEAGLVGYWDFDGDTLDASSSGNHGELFGDAALVANATSPFDMQTNLTYTTTASGTYYVRFRSKYGDKDVKSQYILHLSSQDSSMPVVTMETLPSEGSTNSVIVEDFTVSFSEEMEVATITNAANFELLSSGDDDLFDTGDDEPYALAITYSSGLTASFDIADGPLQPGRIRFTAGTNVTDRSGTPLQPYTNVFSMAGIDGFLYESRSNDTGAEADNLNLFATNLFDGTWSVAQTFATGDQPHDMVSGLFNADAHLDLAVANYAGDSVTVFLGNGDSTFVTATNIAVGDGAHEVVTGFFNADVHLDLAVANHNSDNVTLLFGDGAGAFSNAASYYCGNGPTFMVYEDVTSDGIDDLITANQNSDNVGVLPGNGDGTFGTVIQTYAGNGAYGLGVADFNQDGTNDVAVAARYADVVALLWGQGDGTFVVATNIVLNDEPRRIVAEDLNLDGKPDLAIGNWGSDNVSVLINAGGGVFGPVQDTWVGDTPWLSGQDVDGDTVFDLLVANRNTDSIGVLFGDGYGQFAAPQISAAGDGPIKVLAGQFDAQPGLELAVINYDDDTLQILSPDTTELLAADTVDGNLRTQLGRGNIHNASDIDYWTFEGQAGEQLSIAIDMPSHAYYSRLRWRVYRPDGVRIVDYVTPTYGYGQTTPVTLAMGGRHLMTVQPYDNYFGEYRFRVSTVAPPRLFESEDNNSTGNADAPNYELQTGSRSAQMAGFIHGNDTSGDYFQLGNLGVGTTINLGFVWPDSSTLSAALEIHGPQGLVAALSPATNLVHVTATNGNFYARVSDASSTRGLDARYLLDLTLSDATPPEITGVSLPAEGSETTDLISSFTIGFSEAMDVITVIDPANYELRGSGDDGLLDTADDEIYPLVPGAYSDGSSISMDITGAPLQAGEIRLTISQSLEDILANGLEFPYVRTFTILPVEGISGESRDNGSTATATPFDVLEEFPGLRSGGARGALFDSGDVDYFSFTASSNETIVLGADIESYDTYHRLRYRLVDTNDTILVEFITPYYDSRGQSAPITIPADGTYYVRVSPYDNYFGEYRIHVMAATDPLPIETEANGTIGEANMLSMITSSSNSVGTIAGYVGHVADNDYYSIGPVANEQTILVGVRVPNDSGLVPVVSVYNSAGAYQTEEGATGDGSAEVRVTESNTYFAVVRSGENTGGLGKDYILDVEVLPTAAVVIPNLGVSLVGTPSGGIESGDSILISYIVENIGSAATQEGAWFDRVVLSANKVMGDSDDYPLGTFGHAGDLAIGGSYTNQQTVILPDGISGSFYIVVYTDFGDLVNERLFEGDNIAASASTFPVVLADYPDLNVEGLTVSGSNEVGQVLSIDWNTANRGAAAVSGSVNERLLIKRADNGSLLFSQDYTVSGPLAIDAVVPHSVIYTTVQAVAHTVSVETDYDNGYYEFDAVSHASAEQNTASAVAPVYNYYNVSVTANPTSGGSVAGSGHYRSGTIVNVMAAVDTNVLPYAFFNWTEYGAFRSSSTNYAFMLTRNFNLVANFGLPQFTITALRIPQAGGSVTGAGSFDYGSTNVLRAYPNPGYGFDHWQEGAAPRGTSVSVTNVLYGNREMTAYFSELNPYHTVTTASDPVGVAAVSGAGFYTNGNTAVFAAPQMTTNGASRYIFQRLELNGSYLAATNVYANTFTTLQPSNMHVVAEYTGQPLEPQVKTVNRSRSDPVPATTNFLVDIVFDRSMQPGTPPLVVFTNEAAPLMTFIASSNGTWGTTYTDNDTYRLEPITFAAGDDGDYGVLVSQGADLYGAIIGETNAAMVEVNATPPDNPVFIVASSNATSFTLSWTGYTPPSDLAGFRLFRSTSPFNSVAGLAPVSYLGAASLSGEIGEIQLDTDYYLAVAAVDEAGNYDPVVTGLVSRVDSALPPPVAVTATPVGADGVDLSWDDYDTSTLFGLEGFDIFWQQTDYTDVSALTAYTTLAPGQKSLRIEELDRSVDHYFAVVGYNRLGQYVSAVTTVLWKDPFAGTIAENLTIGTGGAAAAVHDIYRDINVVSNAVLTIEPGVTLRFHAGTGLYVEQGSLSALGTVFNPIVLTSAQASPAPGDWTGLYLGPGAGASEMTHVWTMYGEGLQVDGCNPATDALSVLFNAPAGLMLDGDALLVTTNLLAQFNVVGVQQSGDSQLLLANSIVVNNDSNAVANGVNTMSAPGVWWGSISNTEVFNGLVGNIDYAPFLTTEPLLTPAADTYDGNLDVGSREVPMKYACRVAESMRISEDSTFSSVFFQDFVSSNAVLLSEGGGNKTLYVQYRNVNGETNAPIAVPITYITDGPSITQFDLFEGQVIERPIFVHCAATSPLGVAAVEFYVDDVLMASTNSGTMNVLWDVREEVGGIHRVKFLARDTHGAFTVSEANVTISPEPPPVPVITSPAPGIVTAASSVAVGGTAEPLIGIRLLRNGAVVGETTADANGDFALSVDLFEGNNVLVAVAFDSLGSASSASRTVVRDTGAPEAVLLDPVTFDPLQGLSLTWSLSGSGEAPTSFKVYWDTQPFALASEAAYTGSVVNATEYHILDLADGHYYFGVLGYDGAGNPSLLSNLVEGDYDTSPPSFTIGYNKSSPVGPGPVGIVLTSDEPLSGLPDLLVQPYGASGPILLVVSNTAPNTYEASFNITGLTPSGLAQVGVSASDIYGNVSSGAPSGVDLVIDTTPPSGSIETVPAAPVQVLSNTTMQVNLTLTEPPKPGTVPQVEFDPPAGATIAVGMSGAGLNWSGTLSLNPLMGSGFSDFDLEVVDALDNIGTTITAGESVEIYNTAFPTPPAAPNLLNPVAVKGGYVNLVWYPVSNAETYSLYRIPGDAGIPTTVVADGIVSNGVVDLPPADGFYRYAVTASRRGAESGFSQVYTEYSDRTAPGTPSNVVVQLQASGVQVTWTAPTEGEAPIRYNVYRDGTKVGSPYVPTPINDYPPRGTSVYAVASADWLGNEAYSTSNSFVMLVPAVSSFEILMQHGQAPALSWTFGDPSIAGVNLYRNGIKLNTAPLTGTSFLDSSYTGSSLVQYALKSVDNLGQEGPARTANVYRLELGLGVNTAGAGLPILRYFDAYNATVKNKTLAESFPLETIELRRTYAGAPVTTVLASVTNFVAPNTTLASEVPMASMAGAASQSVRVRMLQTPNASGAQVTYQRLFTFVDSIAPVQTVSVTTTNTPVAGTLADFKTRIHNRGFADMDVVLFKDSGATPGDVYVSLKNELGGEISRGYFQGTVPGVTISGGRGYYTIAPGASLDLWINDVLVPVSLAGAGSLKVQGGVEVLYHQIGSADEQVSGPISGTAQLGLALTEYYGTSSTDKSGYANDEQIIITGQALRRSDNTPLPDTPLRIGFALGSHEWSEEVVTDGTGSYTFAYDVPQGVAGELTLWAAHPDMVDRLDQTTVSVYRMFVLPRIGNIRMSKNDTYTFSLNLLNPGTVPLTGLNATVRAYRLDGTNEIDIATVTATPQWTPDITIGADERVTFPVELAADIDAPDNAVVEIRFSATEGAADTFTGYLTLLEAVPIIDVVSPKSGYVDVTVNRGHVATKTVTVVNRGVRDFKGVTMSPAAGHDWIYPSLVPDADGSYRLPDLPVGASNTFDVVFAPPEAIDLDRYSDMFVISGTNHPATFNVPLYATVSSADKGDLQLFVQNTLSIPVPGATLRLRNQLLGTEHDPVATGPNGIVEVENLQEGLWYWQVTAPGHTTQAGSIDIVADQLNELDTRLTKNVVTVNFTVVPVPFTDRYEIVIEQTFETHVPAPVMVVTPAWQSFEDVDEGFQVRFMVTVKNHGLIALNDLTIDGQEFSWGSMIPLVEYLPRLDPFQEVKIPVLVTYYGDAGGGSQAQRQSAYANCVGDMLGAIYNFGKNLENLINRFAGGYQCVNSLDAATANAAVSVLLKIHEWKGSPLPPGVLELAVLIGCAFEGGGDGGGGNYSGPSNSGGTGYGTGGPVCLAPETLVLLADGRQLEASQLAVGDVVRSGVEDHETAEVADVIHGNGMNWITLGFEDDPEQTLSVTSEHLIWIDGQGWVAAQNVRAGDAVLTDADQRLRVVSVEASKGERPLVSIRLRGDVAMYAEGILVHDQCGWWTPPDKEVKNMEVAP